MKYLEKKKSKSVSHIWTGTDSVCRMYSTGGLLKEKYHVVDKPKNKVCFMCLNISSSQESDNGS